MLIYAVCPVMVARGLVSITLNSLLIRPNSLFSKSLSRSRINRFINTGEAINWLKPHVPPDARVLLRRTINI